MTHCSTTAVSITDRYSSENALPWYALRTKSNFEGVAAQALQCQGYEHYLPVYRSRRRWSDRVVESARPLFPGYLFCRFDINRRSFIQKTPGVVSIVRFGVQAACIPDAEIDAVQMVLRNSPEAQPDLTLEQGQRVRVNRGALEGLEGTLVQTKSDWRIVVTVTMLQRSVSVEIDRDLVSVI